MKSNTGVRLIINPKNVSDSVFQSDSSIPIETFYELLREAEQVGGN